MPVTHRAAVTSFVFDYSSIPRPILGRLGVRGSGFPAHGFMSVAGTRSDHHNEYLLKMWQILLVCQFCLRHPPHLTTIAGIPEKKSGDRLFTIDYRVRSDYIVSMRTGSLSYQNDAETSGSADLPSGDGAAPASSGGSPGSSSGDELAEVPAKDRAQRRAGRTRQRLLNAALEMFSDKGVDPTTIEEITERADVGKGTFYRHFSGKNEVVLALVEDAVDHLVELMSPPPLVPPVQPQPMQRQGPSKLEDALSEILAAHARFFQEHTDEFVLLFQGRVLLKLQREIGEDLDAPYQRYLAEIEHRIGPLTVQPVDRIKIRRLSCAVAGFVSGFFSFAMIGMKPEEIEQSLAPLRVAFLAALSTFLAGV